MTYSAALPQTARAVRFDRYGTRDVLQVREVPMPRPSASEVLVEVRAAGINPGEVIIRSGGLHDRYPATFPSGEGTDLAGVVVATGSDVTRFDIGDAVLGYSWARSSHASHVVVPEYQLIAKPEQLAWEVAGALDVAGTTAVAAVRAIAAHPGEVIAVSGASGGVGTLVTQLLVRQGALVLGIASTASAERLSAHGAAPVPYGPDLADRLLAAGGGNVDAFIDLYGPEYLHLAIDLGITPDRIDTVVYSDAAVALGIRMAGAASLPDQEIPEVLQALADLLAAGELELPIAATFPLERVIDAFEQLEHGHTPGKIVLIPHQKN
ncbi:NADP-dependent oxidoreductase [Glaciibacter flavus]|uniref:NADP-dependent oxidoreductase n=2 Tax=Orlajensenia flava TaxID=2565934 RepID=A0A4S4FTE6_9MICO|nr:NADP-dependent oxidoreductase [Glaciibacter flavus]